MSGPLSFLNFTAAPAHASQGQAAEQVKAAQDHADASQAASAAASAEASKKLEEMRAQVGGAQSFPHRDTRWSYRYICLILHMESL